MALPFAISDYCKSGGYYGLANQPGSESTRYFT